MARPMTICMDFDGVIHSYTSGWKGGAVIPDPPIMGAFAFLQMMIDDPRFEVCIYSSRSKLPGGIDAMKAWFLNHNFLHSALAQMRFPTQKPAAWLAIDDRGMRFQGWFPTLQELEDFRPWKPGEVARAMEMGKPTPEEQLFGSMKQRLEALGDDYDTAVEAIQEALALLEPTEGEPGSAEESTWRDRVDTARETLDKWVEAFVPK